MSPRSQVALLSQRRFLPFFLAQSLGAFNDNLFKQSLIFIILYRIGGQEPSLLINLCALLFILPFFLFSALGGQLGEKCAKDALIRSLKLAEVFIMLLGAAGVCLGDLPLMLTALFGMGTQSALFGPVKYSILPQHLRGDELVAGNALVEMGTFLAILAGTIGAGVLMARDYYAAAVSVAVVLVALSGYLASCGIPRAHAALPDLRLDWNIFRQSRETLRLGLRGQHVSVSRALLGISWFWFLGATYLTQIPAYVRDGLHGDESVVTLILTAFSVGIAVGSMLCARLSGGRLELGLVPLGAIGLSFCGLLLHWCSDALPVVGAALDWQALVFRGEDWWVLPGTLGLGISGGLYIVPLYALIQARTEEGQRSRVVAANNILNALLMVLSALLAMLLLGAAGLSIPQLFLCVSLLNLAVNGYLFSAVPEFVARFLVWPVGRFLYRLERRRLDAIPQEGPALLVCTSESPMAPLLIGAALFRPVRFVLDRRFQRSLCAWILRASGRPAIVESAQDREALGRRIADCLEAGEVVCLFLPHRSEKAPWDDVCGVEVMPVLRRGSVPLIPLVLRGRPGFPAGDGSSGRLRWWAPVTLEEGRPAPVATLRGGRRPSRSGA